MSYFLTKYSWIYTNFDSINYFVLFVIGNSGITSLSFFVNYPKLEEL